MTPENHSESDTESAAVFSIGVARSSYIGPGFLAVVFTALAAVGIYRTGSDTVQSGSILMIFALVCLALPGPLCLVAVTLIARVRITLSHERLGFRGAIRHWSIPWEQLEGIVIHHVRQRGTASLVLDLPTDTDVRYFPVAIIEFKTSEGRRCVRGMQTFQMNIDPETLAGFVEKFWKARTGKETLPVEHALLTPRDAWRLR